LLPEENGTKRRQFAFSGANSPEKVPNEYRLCSGPVPLSAPRRFSASKVVPHAGVRQFSVFNALAIFWTVFLSLFSLCFLMKCPDGFGGHYVSGLQKMFPECSKS